MNVVCGFSQCSDRLSLDIESANNKPFEAHCSATGQADRRPGLPVSIIGQSQRLLSVAFHGSSRLPFREWSVFCLSRLRAQGSGVDSGSKDRHSEIPGVIGREECYLHTPCWTVNSEHISGSPALFILILVPDRH